MPKKAYPVRILDTPTKREDALMESLRVRTTLSMDAQPFDTMWVNDETQLVLRKTVDDNITAPRMSVRLHWTNTKLQFLGVPVRAVDTLQYYVNKLPGWTNGTFECARAPTFAEFDKHIWPGLRLGLSIVFQHVWWWHYLHAWFPEAELIRVQNNAQGDAVDKMKIRVGNISIEYEWDNHEHLGAIYARWPRGPYNYDNMFQWVWTNDPEIHSRSRCFRTFSGRHAISLGMMNGRDDMDRSVRLVSAMRRALVSASHEPEY